MPQTLADFRGKFRVEQNLVYRNHAWSVSLRPSMCTLGASVISANRALTSLAALTPDESALLVTAIAWFETRVRAVFAADKFNYLALMMVDDQAHFHALPRYAAERDFAGQGWRDEGWPGQPDLGTTNASDEASFDAVRRALTEGSPA